LNHDRVGLNYPGSNFKDKANLTVITAIKNMDITVPQNKKLVMLRMHLFIFSKSHYIADHHVLRISLGLSILTRKRRYVLFCNFFYAFPFNSVVLFKVFKAYVTKLQH